MNATEYERGCYDGLYDLTPAPATDPPARRTYMDGYDAGLALRLLRESKDVENDYC